MKESYEEMLERHRREIELLRDSCSHENLSEWREYHWAIGHGSGTFVKVCLFCGESVQAKCCHCDEEAELECDMCNRNFCEGCITVMDYTEKVPVIPDWHSKEGLAGFTKVTKWKKVEHKDKNLCADCRKGVKGT